MKLIDYIKDKINKKRYKYLFKSKLTIHYYDKLDNFEKIIICLRKFYSKRGYKIKDYKYYLLENPPENRNIIVIELELYCYKNLIDDSYTGYCAGWVNNYIYSYYELFKVFYITNNEICDKFNHIKNIETTWCYNR